MKNNKDNPYQTKEQAIISATQWINEHIYLYPSGLVPKIYSIYPFTPKGCNSIVIIDEKTAKTVKRFYFKESEAK